MASLPQSLPVKLALRNPRVLGPEKNSGARRLTLSAGDQVRGCLLDVHKFIGPNRHLHSTELLWELATVITRPLFLIFEWSRQLAEVPQDWKRAKSTLIFKKKDSRNYRPVIFTSVPGKVVEKILLRSMFKQIKDKKVFGSSQHRFTRGKSCLSNLIAPYYEVLSLAEEVRTEHVVYLQ